MADLHQLPFLLKLLDDDSTDVRESVRKELRTFGSSLEEHSQHLHLTQEQHSALNEIFQEVRREQLHTRWIQVLPLGNHYKKLETALSLLADFQNHKEKQGKLSFLLDNLADEYKRFTQNMNSLDLAHFLFQHMKLQGIEPGRYYLPQNSNLVHVIESKRGIPISLSCIYILVGKRLGIPIKGCNFPKHFLTLAPYEKKMLIIDCFNSGRILEEDDLDEFDLPSPVTLHDVLKMECDAATIITRVLHNLMNAYHHLGDAANEQFMIELRRVTKLDAYEK